LLARQAMLALPDETPAPVRNSERSEALPGSIVGLAPIEYRRSFKSRGASSPTGVEPGLTLSKPELR